MFIKSSRASAWLDRPGTRKAASPSNPTAAPRSSSAAPAQRFARRAFEAPLGRCVALRVQAGVGGRPDRLLVLLVPRYTTVTEPRWLPLDDVLTEAQARQWMAQGF
jgi:hypothetical protein